MAIQPICKVVDVDAATGQDVSAATRDRAGLKLGAH